MELPLSREISATYIHWCRLWYDGYGDRWLVSKCSKTLNNVRQFLTQGCQLAQVDLWPSPCAGSDADIRPQSWEARLQRLRRMLLPTTTTSSGPAFARCRIGSNTCPRLRDVPHRLLQCSTGRDSKGHDRQVTTGDERRCSSRQRHSEVWPGPVTATARGPPLAWCASAHRV